MRLEFRTARAAIPELRETWRSLSFSWHPGPSSFSGYRLNRLYAHVLDSVTSGKTAHYPYIVKHAIFLYKYGFSQGAALG